MAVRPGQSGRFCSLPSSQAPLYRSALRATAEEGAWQVAAALLNDLETAEIPASTELYELAIRACDQRKKWQEAVALLERMEQRNVPLSCRAFEAAIRACAKGGAHDMVQLLWGRLRNQTVYGEQPLLPTAITFTVLMRALTEQPDRRQQARDVAASVACGCSLHPTPGCSLEHTWFTASPSALCPPPSAPGARRARGVR